jgi:inositol phosphorylceramide mannosyltransferase catalytic subunit
MSIKTILFPSLNLAPEKRVFPEVPAQATIPRIIHQTFYNPELPEALQKNVDQLKQLNPGWEYRFYDDAAIIKFISANYPPEVLAYFERIDSRYGAARADLFRYLLLYKVGGVYLDIKSTATRPLDAVLLPQDQFLLSEWNNDNDGYDVWGKHYELRGFGGREFQQWYIAASPGHPFLRSVIDNVLANIDTYIPGLHGTGKPGVLRVTGPIAYSLAIHRMLAQHPHRLVDSQRDLGLEYTVLKQDSHKTAFKSHYSLQTHSLIKLGFLKQQLNHFYRFAQWVHDLRARRQGSAG